MLDAHQWGTPVREYSDAEQLQADNQERRARLARLLAAAPVEAVEPKHRHPPSGPRRPLSRVYMRWTVEERGFIRALVAEGTPRHIIAKRLGRSVDGVSNQIEAMRLSTAKPKHLDVPAVQLYRLAYVRPREEAEPLERARFITQALAEANGLDIESLLSVSRRPEVVTTRSMAIWEVAKANPSWSYVRIARFFKRDHSTVIWAVRRENYRRGENLRSCGSTAKRRA